MKTEEEVKNDLIAKIQSKYPKMKDFVPHSNLETGFAFKKGSVRDLFHFEIKITEPLEGTLSLNPLRNIIDNKFDSNITILTTSNNLPRLENINEAKLFEALDKYLDLLLENYNN